MIAWLFSGMLCAGVSLSTAGVPFCSTGEDPAPRQHPMTEAVVLRAAEVQVGDGKVYRPGMIVLMDGEIVAVGKDLASPVNPRTIDLGDVVVTPGLIDAACQLGPSRVSGFAEQSSEVIPHLDIADSIDFDSDALENLAKEGVTCIYVTPEAASVIGSRGAIIKTGGQGVSRFVDAPVTVKANLGPESVSRGARNSTPSSFRGVSFMTRRPTTRMGAVWVFRKAFYDAKRVQAGLPTDADPEAMAALVQVLEGKTGLRFQARVAHDIQSAQRLCSEFGLDHIIEYGQEAFRCMEVLVANQTTVVYGPIFVNATGISARADRVRPCLGTAAMLRDAGVKFCLTACDLSGEQGLGRQAGLAIRNGLSQDEALAAVTSTAASILGVDEKVGLLSRGHDADLVVWSGDPFADTSRVVMTLIDGQAVYDPDHLFTSKED